MKTVNLEKTHHQDNVRALGCHALKQGTKSPLPGIVRG